MLFLLAKPLVGLLVSEMLGGVEIRECLDRSEDDTTSRLPESLDGSLAGEFVGDALSTLPSTKICDSLCKSLRTLAGEIGVRE